MIRCYETDLRTRCNTDLPVPACCRRDEARELSHGAADSFYLWNVKGSTVGSYRLDRRLLPTLGDRSRRRSSVTVG